MTTRREFAQGSLAALLAAFFATMGSEEQGVNDGLEAVPFDPQRHETLAIATVISAGLHSDPCEGLHPMLRYLLLDDPLAPQHEWMRDRCRQQLYAVLHKLEA